MALYKYFYELKSKNKVTITKFIYPEDFLSKNEGMEYTDDEILEVVEKFKQAVKNIRILKT